LNNSLGSHSDEGEGLGSRQGSAVAEIAAREAKLEERERQLKEREDHINQREKERSQVCHYSFGRFFLIKKKKKSFCFRLRKIY